MEESGVFTLMNKNKRVYDASMLFNTINDILIDTYVKDVNVFYRDKKAHDNNSSKFFGVDPQNIFIDYIDVMRP